MIDRAECWAEWENVPASDYDYAVTAYVYNTDVAGWVERVFGVDYDAEHGIYTLYDGGNQTKAITRYEIETIAIADAIARVRESYVRWPEFARDNPGLVAELMEGIDRLDNDYANQILSEFPALWAALIDAEYVGERELRSDVMHAINAMVDVVESNGGEW